MKVASTSAELTTSFSLHLSLKVVFNKIFLLFHPVWKFAVHIVFQLAKAKFFSKLYPVVSNIFV